PPPRSVPPAPSGTPAGRPQTTSAQTTACGQGPTGTQPLAPHATSAAPPQATGHTSATTKRSATRATRRASCTTTHEHRHGTHDLPLHHLHPRLRRLALRLLVSPRARRHGGRGMTLDDLTRDLFRMPDDPAPL